MSYPHDTNFLILTFAVIGAGMSVFYLKMDHPVFKIFARWLLWFCVSIGFGTLFTKFEISDKSLFATALLCFLFWPLAETFYNWLAIDAMSRSGNSLFPNYRAGENVWPSDTVSIRIREFLRLAQYSNIACAIGRIGNEDCVHCHVFEDENRHNRIGVFFIFGPTGLLSPVFSISTILTDGRRIVTDNDYMPFGGFYPENMYVVRRPLARKLKKLLEIHNRRVTKTESAPLKWKGDPVADLNRQECELEELNTSLGFLVEPSQRDELGKISREGRYRIWKEIWMLNYLGRPFSY